MEYHEPHFTTDKKNADMKFLQLHAIIRIPDTDLLAVPLQYRDLKNLNPDLSLQNCELLKALQTNLLKNTENGKM